MVNNSRQPNANEPYNLGTQVQNRQRLPMGRPWGGRAGRRGLAGLVAGAMCVAVAAAGLAIARPPTAVKADSCGTEIVCDPARSKVASSLNVTHRAGNDSSIVVEPQGSTVWNVTAKYRGPGVSTPCDDYTASCTVTATVSNGAITVSHSGCGSANPISYSGVCYARHCGTYLDDYTLYFDVDRNMSVSAGTAYLSQVAYETVSVPDGQLCVGGTESPTSQVFNTADNGQFECAAASCNTPGASRRINYP
jgi:hypothetical protein